MVVEKDSEMAVQTVDWMVFSKAEKWESCLAEKKAVSMGTMMGEL